MLRRNVSWKPRRIEALRKTTSDWADEAERTMSALQGEQRFTGATEPAKILFAYDYRKDRFVFVRQKEFERATTILSGESTLAYRLRQIKELVALSLLSRKQRFFTREEASMIYAAFTTYQQINPTETSYGVSNEKIAVHYSVGLSGYIAGDQDVPEWGRVAVELAINTAFRYPPKTSRTSCFHSVEGG